MSSLPIEIHKFVLYKQGHDVPLKEEEVKGTHPSTYSGGADIVSPDLMPPISSEALPLTTRFSPPSFLR